MALDYADERASPSRVRIYLPAVSTAGLSGMTEDIWSAWLDDRRFSGGEQAERLEATLHEYRETVLDHADLADDDAVLDVGAGDGLVAFGALERLGPDGTVLFADISGPALETARSKATNLGVRDRCEFLVSPAQDLAVADGSVDAVTLRSVLLFVAEKERAFAEFERVLKPGGRLSLFEPVGDFTREMQFPEDTFMRYEMGLTDHEIPDAVRELHGKIQGYVREHSPDHETAMDFTERDLFALAEGAGFEDVHLHLHAYHTRYRETEEWEAWLTTSAGPGTPTKEEAMEAVLTPEEREEFTEYVRPLVESRAPKAARGTPAYLHARKPDR